MNNLNKESFLIGFDNLPKTIDIVIIGGGLNGLQLASDLYSLGERNVLVIEAGDHVESRHVFYEYGAEKATKIWLDPEHNDPSMWVPWMSETPPHYSSWGGLRRKLGGRSLYWHGVCIRLEPWALNESWWPDEIVNDLTRSWKGGPPLYDLLETEIDLWRKFAPEIKANDSTLYSAEIFNQMGYNNAEMVRGMVRHFMDNGKVRFAAYTPLELWTENRTSEELAQIGCNLFVQMIITDKSTARGVRVTNRFTNETKDIYAKKIILAAGTIENSRLVIQSLSNEKQLLQPSLGGLSDHIVQGYFVKVPFADLNPGLISKMQPGPLYLVEKNDISKSNIFAQFSFDNNKDVNFEVWAMGEQSPNEKNYVKCNPQNTMPWTTSVSASLSDIDIQVFNEQRNELQALWDKFTRILGTREGSKINFVDFADPDNTLQNVVINPQQNIEYCTPVSYVSHLGTVEHEGCTLAFGKVIDRNNQVIGIDGLYVIGPCTFPRLGAANPGLTSFALIRRLADILTNS